MDSLLHTPVSALGMLVAAACVVAGAPLFARGLRAIRLRRLLAGLEEHPLGAEDSGCVLVSGRVELESPLFAPISGKACAGFDLSVRAERGSVGDVVSELRPFRLVTAESSARVLPERSRWHAAVTAERTIAPADEVPIRLLELFDRSAEVRWLRDRRVPLRVVERSFQAGVTVSVLGVVQRERRAASNEMLELSATGTDGGAFTARTSAPAFGSAPGEQLILAREPLGHVFVSAEPPRLADLRPAAWLGALTLLGPLLTLGGLLYLAIGASALIAGRS